MAVRDSAASSEKWLELRLSFVAAFLFLLLLGFAIKNTDPVAVHYFLDWEWHAPLSLVLFVFFIVGAALGVMAAGGSLYRHRRAMVQLKRELRATQATHQAHDVGPERRLL